MFAEIYEVKSSFSQLSNKLIPFANISDILCLHVKSLYFKDGKAHRLGCHKTYKERLYGYIYIWYKQIEIC